jgi:O-antigen/teichoic acid export membrane protein
MKWALLKNVGYLTLGSQAANFFQFVFFLYFARSFGDEAVGRYSFAFSFTYVMSVLADLGVSAYLTCEIAKRPTDYARLLARGLVLRLSSLAVLAVVGTIAVAKLFGGLDPENVYTIALLGGYQFFCGVADLFLAELKGHDRMGVVAALNVTVKLLIAAAGIALVAFGVDYLWVIACFPICGLIYAGACVAWCAHLFGSPGWSRSDIHVGPVLRGALPFAFTLVFVEVLYNADTLLVRAFANEEAVGMYSVALRIVMIFPAMLGCVFTALLPTFARLHIESAPKLNELSVQSLRYLLIWGLPVSTGLFALSHKAVALLFTEVFLPAAVGMRILSWMVALSCAAVVPSVLLTVTGRQKAKSIGIGICLAANVSANCVLIPRVGWQGAAWARLGAEALQLAILGAMAAGFFRRIPWRNLLVKPAAACTVMYVLVAQLDFMNIVALVCLGIFAYFGSLALLRGFEKHEVAWMALAAQRVGLMAGRQ